MVEWNNGMMGEWLNGSSVRVFKCLFKLGIAYCPLPTAYCFHGISIPIQYSMFHSSK